MPSRKPYPMPLGALDWHPVVPTLSAAAFGALMRLCLHYWRTDCAPLPASPAEIKQIARAHHETWKRRRNDILAVFDAWAAETRHAFERRAICRHAGGIAGLNSVKSRREKAATVADHGSHNLPPPARTSPLRQSPQRMDRPVNGATPSGLRLWRD